MFSTDDTIAAIATPIGRSGVGVIRLSGSRAAAIACALVGRTRSLEPRRATFARLSTANILDQVIVTMFPAPKSYTGEDVVEISAHGSPVVLQGILRAAIAAGARLAQPGEFTLRAFLHGKLDLPQAEAVADLVAAVTPRQARAAFDQLEGTLTGAIQAIEEQLFDLIARLEASLDFPEEGYHFIQPGEAATEVQAIGARIDALLAQASRGRLIREGAQIAILGTPNVGKSSLFNALVNANRAIVTAIPGTTRDMLTERADIGGVSVGLVDTAGIRASADPIEQEGISRARQAASIADLTLLLLDASRPLSDDDRELLGVTRSARRLVVISKIDLARAWSPAVVETEAPVEVSVTAGAGLQALVDRTTTILGDAGDTRDQPIVTNVRHIALLERARLSLTRAANSIAPGQPVSEEFLLADLQEASSLLQEITGQRTTDDLLEHIFKTFCVGK